jgi:hypothetical protein
MDNFIQSLESLCIALSQNPHIDLLPLAYFLIYNCTTQELSIKTWPSIHTSIDWDKRSSESNMIVYWTYTTFDLQKAWLQVFLRDILQKWFHEWTTEYIRIKEYAKSLFPRADRERFW